MYIFLDLDGVINVESSWKRKLYDINDKCVQSLAQIVLNLNGKIILTSSWRLGYDKSLNHNHSAQIKELISAFAKYNMIIADVTGHSLDDNRYREIQHYIHSHQIADDDYLILDDDKNMFRNTNDVRIYFTDAKTGLTNNDVKNICKKYKKRRKFYEQYIFKIKR